MANSKPRNKWDRKKKPRRERRPEDRHAYSKLADLLPQEQRVALEQLKEQLER